MTEQPLDPVAFDPAHAAATARDPLACDTADPGMDASGDDALAVNTDATPDPGSDGVQDDVDQAPVTEGEAQAEADVAAADEDPA